MSTRTLVPSSSIGRQDFFRDLTKGALIRLVKGENPYRDFIHVLRYFNKGYHLPEEYSKIIGFLVFPPPNKLIVQITSLNDYPNINYALGGSSYKCDYIIENNNLHPGAITKDFNPVGVNPLGNFFSDYANCIFLSTFFDNPKIPRKINLLVNSCVINYETGKPILRLETTNQNRRDSTKGWVNRSPQISSIEDCDTQEVLQYWYLANQVGKE